MVRVVSVIDRFYYTEIFILYSELFTILLDMLSVLIHGTLISEGAEKEENKRTYMNLIKKLRVRFISHLLLFIYFLVVFILCVWFHDKPVQPL